MKNYDKNKESPYLQYWDVNNLYGWAMSQNLPVNNFEWIKDTSQFNEDFIKNCNEESDEGYFVEVDVQYLEKLHELHNDLLFLPERMKIEKVEKLVCNLHDKTEYVIYIRNSKQAINYYLGLSILDLSKLLMYEFWYDYVKQKYNEKAKLCYMDTNSFILYIIADDIYKDIAEDIEIRFDRSNYELECNSINRPLPKGKNKKIVGLMEDKLGGKIIA